MTNLVRVTIDFVIEVEATEPGVPEYLHDVAWAEAVYDGLRKDVKKRVKSFCPDVRKLTFLKQCGGEAQK